MLRATELVKSFGGNRAVDRVSLAVPEGRITALIGPNGAGKTTLFNLLSGTASPDAGTIRLWERDVTRLPAETRARAGISRTFQLPRPFVNLTVGDHLRLAADDRDDALAALFAAPRQAAGAREALALVGLDLPLATAVADLSYGQSKLLALAMAVLHPHRILLLDEPVAGVNPVIRERIAQALSALRGRGETLLVIEHDMDFIMPLADQVVVMDRGRVIAAGTPEEVRAAPAVLAAYLGDQL